MSKELISKLIKVKEIERKNLLKDEDEKGLNDNKIELALLNNILSYIIENKDNNIDEQLLEKHLI